MNKKTFFPLILMVTGVVLLSMTLPAAASPAGQVYYFTPTPQLDGRIIYVVKADETCTSIALLNNITVDKIRELNNIQDPACPLKVGQDLILGVVQSMNQTATPGPSPTPTVPLPSVTPLPGNGEVCIYLYDDINGNAMAEAGESPIAGGAVNMTNRDGSVTLNGDTTDGVEKVDMLCFREVVEGDYNISVAVPQGYNATTSSQVNFGAQVRSLAPENVTGEPTDAPQQGGVSPLLGILGALLLAAGIGLGIYVFRMRR
jgi:murein DD-endopeptidase MepM/ murein hydrolase activator NlpD